MAVKPADFPPLVVEYTGDFLAGVDEVGRGPLVAGGLGPLGAGRWRARHRRPAGHRDRGTAV